MLIIQFIIGCIVGSFICLAAERVPIGGSIISPASQCVYCKTNLRFYDLLPIISIILLRFRCRYCHHRLSISYLFSELVCGLLFVATTFTDWYSVYTLFFLLTTFTLTLTDIFYLIVEPKFFYPFGILLCVCHYFFGLPLHMVTGICVFITLISFTYVFPKSIGGGDILLVSLWGVLLGNRALIFLLFIASSCALLFLLFCHFFLNKKIQQLPFVPFLNIGLLCIIFI
ncbi:prepilin peptidase [Enterococcus termitis]|uniref:prepilin peptidase n=1 Tax=Enterococcus termitis TaxID=332950 RepID=UPI0008FFFB85|nr:A24 family peptidase [Enterococcus termitis]OJG96561.1 hypothetical protein RV18_GL002067 [Enterococcus termitis]